MSNLNAVEFVPDAVRRFSGSSCADVSPSDRLSVVVELARIGGRRFRDETVRWLMFWASRRISVPGSLRQSEISFKSSRFLLRLNRIRFRRR